jgi:hypothetical protein
MSVGRDFARQALNVGRAVVSRSLPAQQSPVSCIGLSRCGFAEWIAATSTLACALYGGGAIVSAPPE